MKLIPLIILTMSTVINVKSNEHFTFPPQFHQHSSGVMSPDRTVYLPPESHTSVPYYPMKNVNLPFPYLPSTVTKAPAYFSSPFPMMMSSTLLNIEKDDDNDEDDEPRPQYQQIQKNNRTQRSPLTKVETRELRPKQINYQPIDRIDVKTPFGFTANPNQGNKQINNATPRSMIISAPDTHRNDYAIDHMKAAGFQGPQYIAAPNIPGVYLSSTTETAVPIIRLSNEMDLDGSFSYEALGADQTHYVQHSRMDNMGSDKQEQVVEGSYSYVGDNGQTYTVNYIADSNGFRASGDHLPVAPPIPEIIQRSIQYNLAEEAKKPPHMKSWQNEENQLSENERNQQRYASPQHNLFTGKTPESFSFAFSQGSQNTQNNLVPAASNQTPIKANVDFTPDQMKGKINNGISPQITFLASQGAHVPSVNPQPIIPTIGRVFTTERSTLPRLMNYEAGLKESEESNKALWRWQYGLNANVNQTPEKNSISRSFGEDDVMINFNDMTPQQYTSMIHSQLQSNNGVPQNEQSVQPSQSLTHAYQQQDYHQQQNDLITNVNQAVISSTENYYVPNQAMDWYQNNKQYEPNPQVIQNSSENINQNNKNKQPEAYPNGNQNSNTNTHYVPDTRAILITQNTFIPPSQTVTNSYNYEEMEYEPQKVKPSTLEPLTQSTFGVFNPEYKPHNYEKPIPQNAIWSSSEPIQTEQIISTTEAPATTTYMSGLKFTDFVNKNDFRPVYKQANKNAHDKVITTTESDENLFRDNIFLRNLFKADKIESAISSKIKEDPRTKADTQPNIVPERKHEKSPKFIAVKSNPLNEMQTTKNKPMDMVDVMNFISLKNHFESAKTKSKSKIGQNNYKQRNEMRFIPVQMQEVHDTENENMEHSASDLRSNRYQPEELRGIIKNYKVLQRNNSAFTQESEQLSRDLSPPPVKISSNLPPLGRAGPSMKSYLPPIYV